MATLKYKTENGYVSLPMTIPTKSNEENGNGIGTCDTSSGTALEVTLPGYELILNGMIAVSFENDVPTNSTLNINCKGAKPIYYKGSAITANTIKADDTVMFAYDGTNYVVTSLGGGSASGLEIVAASGTTLTAEVGKYYRYDSEVSTLAVTLPTITGATEVQEFKMYFHTASSSISVTFTGGTIVKLGEFLILPSNKYCVDCVWNGSTWILQTNNTLPYDSQIEYLQSDRNQYIDTGVLPSIVSTKVTGKFRFNALYSWSGMMGCSNGDSAAFKFMRWINTSSWGFTTNGNVEGSGTVDTNTDYIFEFLYSTSGCYLKINGETKVTSSGTLNEVGLPIYLFGHNHYLGWDARKSEALDGRIYECKIYVDTVLVRDFVPVRVGQTGYMYDKVNRKLYGNIGTGNFVLGPDV